MKKRVIAFGMTICILFTITACGTKDNTNNHPGTEQQEHTDQQNDTMQQGLEEGQDREEQSEQQEQAAGETPIVTFTDFSQKITDEETGDILLDVQENCPVISLPGNETAQENMNKVFEQQHTMNQTVIKEDKNSAEKAYEELTEEDMEYWNGYGFGCTYETIYASPEILSIKAVSYEWQGTPHPNTWTSAYCFDVSTGKLLTLADVFENQAEAKKIVEQHILDTVTADPYKDGLLEDYESYISDILTNDVFYFNEQGLVVICNPYLITAYAAGTIEIEVPYEDLTEVLK